MFFSCNVSMNQPEITLLICTHDGGERIKQVLEAIANQADISRDVFEVLIVDNASTDRTFEIATDALKHLNLHGQVLCEPKIGKINAFLKGIYEAQSELISIIDDDNFIEPGFIRYTLEVFSRYSNVGITGSTNHIYIDQSPPPWFQWTTGRYACSNPWLEDIEQKDSDGVIVAQTGIIAGAGLTFRIKPILSCLEKGYNFFNDYQRNGKWRVSSEDVELCWLMRSLGYDFAHDPRIQLRHAIKVERLSLKYFENLCRTAGAGSLGADPFIFTHKHNDETLPIQWTWQWQLLSKLKRYIRLVIMQNLKATSEEQKFRNWRDRVECMGAIQRILYERDKYTQHIRQVAVGDWTELRVR